MLARAWRFKSSPAHIQKNLQIISGDFFVLHASPLFLTNRDFGSRCLWYNTDMKNPKTTNILLTLIVILLVVIIAFLAMSKKLEAPSDMQYQYQAQAINQ